MSDKSSETIAKKLAKLSELVAWFESDEFVLEEATERFTEAQKLAEEIENELTKLKNEIVVLKKKFDED